MRALLVLALAGLALTTAAGFAARLGFPLELFSHFRPHYFITAALAAGLALVVGRRKLALGLAGLALVNALAVAVPLRGAVAALGHQEPTLTAVWANLEYRIEALGAVARLADETGADVVALTELPFVEYDFAPLFPAHPCRDAPAELSVFTVVILTRAPCGEAATASAQFWPNAARLGETGSGALIVATHPIPPMTAANQRRRDALARAAAETAARRGADLFVGDFNATPWSPLMIEIASANLRRVDCGAPWRSTWRSRLPLLGLPIDAAFAGPGVAVARCEVGPDIGSDHFPLIIEMTVAAPGGG